MEGGRHQDHRLSQGGPSRRDGDDRERDQDEDQPTLRHRSLAARADNGAVDPTITPADVRTRLALDGEAYGW
jgi:hypothetical protein